MHDAQQPAPRFDWLDDGFVAVIQGATRGIGLAVVRQLLASPQPGLVVATGRSAADSAALAELAASAGDRLLVLTVDVTDPASIAQLAEQVATRSDRVQLLFNVAGVLHDDTGLFPEKQLAQVDLDALERSFRVNAFGPLLVSRALAPLLLRGAPAILANLSARVGSIADNRLGGWYAYRGAKAAQNMFTRSLSIELARRSRQLACVALHPGTTDTALSAPFQARVPAEQLFSVERTAAQLLTVLAGLRAADNGRFIAWDGSDIPW